MYHIYTLDDKGERVLDSWLRNTEDAASEFMKQKELNPQFRVFLVANTAPSDKFCGKEFAR